MRYIISLFLIIILILLGLYNYDNYKKYGDELKKRKFRSFGGLEIDSLTKDMFIATNLIDTVFGVDYQKAVPKDEILQVGTSISINARVKNGDTVSVDYMFIHKGRVWKIVLSTLPVFLWIYLFLKYFKIDLKKMVIRKRNA